MLKIANKISFPLDAVTQTFGILAVRGAGKSNLAAVMAEQMYEAKLPFVVVDPVGSWWGLRSSADGTGPGLSIPIFGGRHGDVPLEKNSGQMIADLVVDDRLSCVLDCSEFSEGDKIHFLIDFSERLYRRNQYPLHLFLEEADDYAPQRPFREQARLLRAWENVVRRGRARGLGITMITQRSAALNKNVLSQIETLIVLRTTSPNDRKAIEAWVEYHGQSRELVESLPRLESGEAWIWSPSWLKVLERVKIPRRQTFDSGATPKDIKGHRPAATLADIDLAKVRDRMKATIERAKAEDPRELKKRIAELERELRAKPAAVAPEPVRVEVPLIDSKTVENLNALAAAVHAHGQGAINTGKQIADQLKVIVDAVSRFKPVTAHRGIYIPQPPQLNANRKSPRVPRSAESTSDLKTPERKILTALAQYPEGLELDRLAVLSGYTVNGHFTNVLGGLRTQDFVTGPRIIPIQITQAGLNALGSFDPLPTGVELRVYWLNKLPTPEQRIFSVLINRYPDSLGLDELAAEAGYTVNGHFTNVVGSLRSKGLMTPARQPIRASEHLFSE